jgi:hypothetical protein
MGSSILPRRQLSSQGCAQIRPSTYANGFGRTGQKIRFFILRDPNGLHVSSAFRMNRTGGATGNILVEVFLVRDRDGIAHAFPTMRAFQLEYSEAADPWAAVLVRKTPASGPDARRGKEGKPCDALARLQQYTLEQFRMRGSCYPTLAAQRRGEGGARTLRSQ